jgi:4-diphosphocytidyl-2-C-methyl-D-erythritol kinase
MQRISLADRLTIERAEGLSLACSQPSLEGPENLVWRAAERLRDEAGVRQGVALRLEKHIPVAAGLGGGSSDCAAALRGLNELWELGLTRERLMELGAELGSDVPFFLLEAGSGLAEGRGERLTPLLPLPERWLVLVKPDVGISAGAVYGALERGDWSAGARTSEWLAVAHRTETLPAPFNALERASLAVEPRAAGAREALIEAGAMQAIMSGSGSTYFALFEAEVEAERVAGRVRKAGWDQVWVARFVTL